MYLSTMHHALQATGDAEPLRKLKVTHRGPVE